MRESSPPKQRREAVEAPRGVWGEGNADGWARVSAGEAKTAVPIKSVGLGGGTELVGLYRGTELV